MSKQTEKLFRQVTAILLTLFLTVCIIAMYQQYDAILVTFYLVLLAGIWYQSGKEQ